MGDGVYQALAGMDIKKRELENVAHNIANSNTPGFKEEVMSFESVLISNDSSEVENFSVESSKDINFAQGSTTRTANDFDFALQGEGFFEVTTNEGSYYTRNGGFSLDSNGNLVTHKGYKVAGTSGNLNVPSGGHMSVGKTGIIKVDGNEVGQIKVVRFDDESKLVPAGFDLYEAKEGASPIKTTATEVTQGYVEHSNVNVMTNLVRLVDILREYQKFQNVIQSQKEADAEADSVGDV